MGFLIFFNHTKKHKVSKVSRFLNVLIKPNRFRKINIHLHIVFIIENYNKIYAYLIIF